VPNDRQITCNLNWISLNNGHNYNQSSSRQIDLTAKISSVKKRFNKRKTNQLHNVDDKPMSKYFCCVMQISD
jgi:hypothetical protein